MPPTPVANPRVRFDVLLERDGVMAVAKPRGVATEPGPGHRSTSLLNGLAAQWPQLLEMGDARDWGLLHRLDRDTSGVVLASSDPMAYDELRGAFALRTITKRYLAVVEGRLSAAQGTTSTPLRRVQRGDALISVPDPKGQEAVTHWCTLAREGPLSLVEVRIETGRTHQIRVHLAHQGAAILGDRVYRPLLPPNTSGFRGTSDLRLHAWEVALTLAGEHLTVRAPIPGGFLAGLPASLVAMAASLEAQ